MNTRLARTVATLTQAAYAATASGVLILQTHAPGRTPAALTAGGIVVLWAALAVAYCLSPEETP